jgi:hypothetical protein
MSYAARSVRLAVLILSMCCIAGLGAAAPALADDSADGGALALGSVEKASIAEDGAARTYTIEAPSDKKILIGAVNLDDPNATSTSLRLSVTCPLPASLIPAGDDGVSVADNGRAIFCSTPAEGSTTIRVTISSLSDTVNYGLFAQSIKTVARESPLDLPGDARVIDTLNAQRIHLYWVKYNAGYDDGWSALQYRGDDPKALARVYSSVDGRVQCRAVRWKYGSDRPGKSATCNFFNGSSSSYLVVMNYGNNCYKYKLHTLRASETIEDATIGTCP